MIPDRKKIRTLLAFWFLLLLSLTIYSYSQIDLNLTLSSFGLYQVWQQKMIGLGYYHRQISAAIFGLLILGLSGVSYLLTGLVQRGYLTGKKLWYLIVLTTLTLLLSYPAFSHDVFNYLFNAKIVSHYHLNPYQFKALDFPEDSWIRFMRWTHRPNVYPPIWLAISLPATFFGFGKFTVSLLVMKLIMASFFLLAALVIKRLAGETALALWVFNPLILIESLVSAHNDVVMMALALASIWFLKQRRYLTGILFSLMALGVKFVGGVAGLPFLMRKWPEQIQLKLSFGLLTVLTVIVSWRLGFQPWYFCWPLALAAFRPERKLLTWILSTGALLTYYPYLARGDWGGGVEALRNSFAAVLLVVSPWWVFSPQARDRSGVPK